MERFSDMKRFPIILTLMFAALAVVLPSGCINDDFTTSPTDVLSFSTDTLNMDTVFTGQGTPTARLLVFNRNKKAINISTIKFSDPDGYFAMNVDGRSGKVFQDIEVRGNDSIYIFIECYPPETTQTTPYLLEEKLQFVTNGVPQQVVVEAYGQNVTRLRNVRLTEDTRFTAEQPYIVTDSLTVAPGVTLSIDPGVQLLFHDKAKMVVEGRIEAVGEVGKMIAFRGDRLDNVLPEVPYDLLAGQWEGVRIADGSTDNRLEYVDMRSTVSGLRLDSCADASAQRLTLVNSWLHNSQGNVISANQGKVSAFGCVFSEAPQAVVALTGGEHQFVQCTFSNNYLFAAITEPILTLYHLNNENNSSGSVPYMKARFENCILYGMGNMINIGDLADTDVYFYNTLFKSEGSDDEHFIECLWDADPLFYTVREDYIFNYRLRPDSPAIGAGNPAFVTPICLYDMDGNDRLRDGNPALGAYVFLAPKTEEQ